MYPKLAPTIRQQAQAFRVDRFVTLLLLAIAAAGLPACDEKDPTGTDLTTSTEGAQASVEATTADGDGSAAVAASDVTALSTIALPINQSIANSGVVFGITQTGLGPSGFFKINNTTNAKDALLGQSNGTGNALHALATGPGHAAVFEATNPSSIVSAVAVIAAGAGEGLRAQQRGLGHAGYFENVNANSTASTMELLNLGKGKALNVTSSSNSVATFLLNNPGSANTALIAETKGPGTALQGLAPGGIAVRGAASTGIGGFFGSNAATLPALLARTTGSDYAAVFQAINATGKGVRIETKGGAGLQVVGGSFQVVGGSKNAVVPTPSGAKALYTEESTEVWFTDYGFARLKNGRARILFDPSFAQTINPEELYHVFLQSYGDAELYVRERTSLGFEVALRAGDPNADFSYRIVAKRLGFEQKRLEPAPWADHLAGGPSR